MNKSELRLFYKEKRKKISKNRRKQVKERLIFEFLPLLDNFPYILSFASKKEEIDLWKINQKLAREGRLILPRMEGNHLYLFQVKDVVKDLESRHFYLKEPKPSRCPSFEQSKIDLILAPGLAFDAKHYRLGYGMGFYDRLLSLLPQIPSWGVGFSEQYSKEPLPIEKHDVPLSQLLMY